MTVQLNGRIHEAARADEPKDGLGWKPAWRRGLAQIVESPLFPAALIAAAFILYARALGGAFVSDDEQQILQNPFVTNPHLWRHIFGDSVWAFMGSGNSAKFYRPMMISCFWVIYRLAGPEPFYFHLLQLFLFAGGAVALYITGKELAKSKIAALIASLLWIVHPQKVEAVAWISALCDTGCGLFYFVAFYLFLRAESRAPGHERGAGAEGGLSFRRLSALSWAAFAVALLFKEMALSFPLILVAYWFFHPWKGSATARAMRLAPYVALIGIYLAVRRLALGHLTANGHLFHITGKIVADALALLGDHTRIFFRPAHLSIYRVFDAEKALASPWPWAVLLALAIMLVFRKRQPELAFCIFWWPLALAPCLDIRQLSNPMVADRMSYIPSAGLCLAAGFLLAPLCAGRAASGQTHGAHWARRAQGPHWARPIAIAGVCVLFVLGWMASARTIPQWNNNQAIVNYSLKRDLESAYVHLIHGWELRYRENDLPGAAREFETAARLNRESPRPQITVEYQSLIGLGAVAQARGNLNAAIADYQHAVRVAPRLRDAYLSLGTLYLPHGEYAQAASYFEKALEGDRYDPSAAYLLGTCWMKLGKFAQAAQVFHAAREVDPHFWQAYQEEAQALKDGGEPQQADAVLVLLAQRKPH